MFWAWAKHVSSMAELLRRSGHTSARAAQRPWLRDLRGSSGEDLKAREGGAFCQGEGAQTQKDLPYQQASPSCGTGGMPVHDEILYNNQLIAFLEEIWGDGYLSPGGPDEVARVLTGVDVTGQHVLDIGSGSGACAIALVQEYGASRVTGIDVEDPVCDAARDRVSRAGVTTQIEILKVDPGPFPFADGAFDVVFSKDAIIHIPDKAAMARGAFRVLKPGGRFAASDWLMSHDGPPSAQMTDYIKEEGLDFAMASPRSYATAMEQAGFVDVELVNRNPWYAKVAAQELAWLVGPDRPDLSARHGQDFIDHQVDIWTKLVGVLESGEHCPHHIRARKPV